MHVYYVAMYAYVWVHIDICVQVVLAQTNTGHQLNLS